MDEKTRAELRDSGLGCLNTMENLVCEALQESDFRSAEHWLHQHAGGAKVLETLRLISNEEYCTITEPLFARWSRAKYPNAYKEDA